MIYTREAKEKKITRQFFMKMKTGAYLIHHPNGNESVERMEQR